MPGKRSCRTLLLARAHAAVCQCADSKPRLALSGCSRPAADYFYIPVYSSCYLWPLHGKLSTHSSLPRETVDAGT